MEPSLIIQLRKEFEALKQFREKNAPNRLSYFGYIVEFIVGIALIGQSISTPKLAELVWAQYITLAVGITLLAHALYLIFRFHNDKRWMGILERLLSGSSNENNLKN